MSNPELPRPNSDQPPVGEPGIPVRPSSLADRLEAARAYVADHSSDNTSTEGLPPIPSVPADDDDTVGVDTDGIDARLDQAEADGANDERRRNFRDMLGRISTARERRKNRKAYRKAENDVHHDLSHAPKRLVRESERPDGKLVAIPIAARHGSGAFSRLDRFTEATRSGFHPDYDNLTEDQQKRMGLAERLRIAGLDPQNPNDEHAIQDIIREYTLDRAKEAHHGGMRAIREARPETVPGHKLTRREKARYQILNGKEVQTQRRMYAAITGLTFDRNGTPQGELSDWAPELSPHNIADLRELYIERYLANADVLHNRRDIPEKHLKAGSVGFLDDGLMAAYFGVSLEEWLAQKRGETEIVPTAVLNAVGHYLSFSSDELRDSVGAAIPQLPDSDDPNHNPVERASQATHVPDHVWRRELGYRQPALDPDQAQELQQLLPDLRHLSREIDAAARKEEADRKKKRRLAVLPKAEHDSIRDEVTELVLTGYLNGSSPDEIARYRMYLDLLSQQRR